MKVLFLYVSTNMCRDGDLWYYDEGVASTVSCLQAHGHRVAFRLVGADDELERVVPWVERERGERTLIVFLTSVLFSAYAHDIPDTFDRVQGLKRATGLPTAFVGMWATANAERLIEHPGIDFVGRGGNRSRARRPVRRPRPRRDDGRDPQRLEQGRMVASSGRPCAR